MELLSLHQIRKCYGERTILDIEALSLHAGECLLLGGRNGTGKTTLLKIVAGLLEPDHALVHIGPLTRPWRRLRRELRRRVIYLHQHPYMFDASVEQNIAYGLHKSGIKGSDARTRVQAALRWAGLEHLAAKNAKTLSGGECQRVALARAWVLEPRVLLLDEPTASMDQAARVQTAALLQRLKSEQTSLVVTSHEPGQLAGLATAVLDFEQHGLVQRPLAGAQAAGNELLRLREVVR